MPKDNTDPDFSPKSHIPLLPDPDSDNLLQESTSDDESDHLLSSSQSLPSLQKPHQTPNPSLPTLKQIASCLALLFTILNIIPLILLLSHHFEPQYPNLLSTTPALQSIAHNLQLSPIIDLQIIPKDQSCPTNFSPLNLGNWPGTISGCSCPNQPLRPGSCSAAEKSTCMDIKSQDSVPLDTWLGSRFCARRASNSNKEYLNAENCPQNYQQCSPGICIVTTLQCPITSVSIASEGDSTSQFAENSNGENKYLVMRRTLGDLPLVNIEVTPNGIPCFNQENIPSEPKHYSLLSQGQFGCQNYGRDNDSSKKLNKQTEYDILVQNGVSSEILGLPGYESILKESNYVLSGRQRIETANNNQACFALNDGQIMSPNNYQDFYKYSLVATVITGICLHGVLVAILIGLYTNSLKKNGFSVKNMVNSIQAQPWFTIFAGIGALEFVDIVVMFTLLRHYDAKIKPTREYFLSLEGLGCFAEGTTANQVIGDQNWILGDFAYKGAIWLLSGGVCLFIPYLWILYKRFEARDIKFF